MLTVYRYDQIPSEILHLCAKYYVIDLLHEAGRSHCTTKLCDRYQFYAAMTFLSWFISTT
ncbi:hypothetical protein MTR_4g103900 [Medicago truncatula]|uniref:Uncharacterized protein n=1 Tax=Medicago truncatula TaxID=3880 RepID=G7JML0_MEDTR|nr:hypothetical protein MTR_4g103900 [Medicago truncatula]